MKKLFILSALVIMMTSLSAQCYKVDTVFNTATVKYLLDRPVEFGAKATLEELISDKYSLCDSGSIVSGEIVSIAMPEQLLNIVGLQFLKRQYIITTKVVIDGKTYMGTATKTMFVNAMFVEVSGIPHNKKVFYKTMQQSLKNAVYYIYGSNKN
jgi:hypothetical protein